MSSKGPHPFLPYEIILYIVDCVIPRWEDTAVSYEPSHLITRTLIALTRTSRTIYPTARRLLYTHCLYIDSPGRLRCLLNSLQAYTSDSVVPQQSITTEPSTIRHETSLYLAPFIDDSIDDLPTAQAVHDLLSVLAPTLRRLVIDIPLRSLYPVSDTLGIRPILRRAFTKLTSLELFCSARDELFLNTLEWPQNHTEVAVWTLWPKLKMLALYNCDLTPDPGCRFWRDLPALKHLETLVLTRCDGVQEIDFKAEWRRVCGNEERPVLNVVFVDVDGQHGLPLTIEEPKEGDTAILMAGRVPISYYGDEDNMELCQDWIKRCALRGEHGFEQDLRSLISTR